MRPQPCYSSPGHGGGGDRARGRHSWRGGKVRRVFLHHVSNPSEEEGSMTASSIYDYDKARPSWDPSHHKWPWGSKSRSQHSGVTLPGTPSRTSHVYLPFLFVCFHLLPSQGEKAQQVPEECGMLLLLSGCSLEMAPVARGWGTACLLLPRCSRTWGMSTSSG